MGEGPREPRDWNAVLLRVLEPFRSEAAAFRVLVGTVAVFGLIVALVVLARTLGA